MLFVLFQFLDLLMVVIISLVDLFIIFLLILLIVFQFFLIILSLLNSLQSFLSYLLSLLSFPLQLHLISRRSELKVIKINHYLPTSDIALQSHTKGFFFGKVYIVNSTIVRADGYSILKYSNEVCLSWLI
jgi:hypothetical protein